MTVLLREVQVVEEDRIVISALCRVEMTWICHTKTWVQQLVNILKIWQRKIQIHTNPYQTSPAYQTISNKYFCQCLHMKSIESNTRWISILQPLSKLFSSQDSIFWQLCHKSYYRVSHKYLNDFFKMGVASKRVKPRLQNFLCFLSIIMANFSENLVAIASIFPLSMALLCHISGGHR